MEKLTLERQSQLLTNLEQVRAELAQAATDAGRSPNDVKLAAISKYHPAATVAALAGAGQRIFGESYVQEALAKREELEEAANPIGAELEWHFVGRLQSNKAKYVAGRFALVHSVDSLKLARQLQKSARDRGSVQAILLQVNLAGEVQKAGASPEECRELAGVVLQMDALRLKGLMLMPPAVDDPEDARPHFAGLRKLRDTLEGELGIRLPELSMGMTGDFKQAVAEGATCVRIGTRLFGPRPQGPAKPG